MAAISLVLSGIYVILHIASGRAYVGSAVNLHRRWREHRRFLEADSHRSLYLQHAWTKHSGESFEFRIIELVPERHDLLTREQFWIDHYRCAGYCLNCLQKAGSQLGYKHSDETKLKMSIARIGRTLSPAHIENMRRSLTGQKWTEDRRSAASGKKRPRDVVDKIAANWIGRKHSKESLTKMSIAHKGVTLTDEHKAKIGAAQKGRPHSAIHHIRTWETRRKNLCAAQTLNQPDLPL